ncbi:MAG: FGGY-family carbohydrate kinase [Granulosicoccus sp.]
MDITPTRQEYQLLSEELVIGLDSSTQSTKAIAWNREGKAIAEGRADIPMANPQLDFYEQQSGHWWQAAVNAIAQCTAQIDGASVKGLAISNQRETLAFLDEDDQDTRPAILWLDERSREQVKTFASSFGSDRIHAITGRRPDTTSCLYTFAWLREQQPDIYQRTAKFVDVQSYLVKQLCGGEYRTGWISADPMGIVDMVKHEWSRELMNALDLDDSRLSSIHPPGTRLGTLTDEVANLLNLPQLTPVFAAGGDGQCAGLGVNCTVPDRAYINLGTAVVSGIWSKEYRYNDAWRTELAAQGEGYILENCLRSGAFLINWFVDQFVAHGKATQTDFDKLEHAASALPIGAEGLLVQPYFGGSMDPHWDSSARGIIMGLGASHSPAHIYRALLEGITLDQAMRTQDMEAAAGQTISHLVAIGGGANSKLWTHMLADACGKPVHISTTLEASALGAGMIAAYGTGWYDTITEAANAMSGETSVIEPDPINHQRYQALLGIYRKIYQSTREINHELMAFSASSESGIQ